MPDPQGPSASRWITPALAGAVLGPALQVQQPALWTAAAYAGLGALGVALLAGAARRRGGRGGSALVLLAFALAGFAACGWRAERFLARGLDPALEGRDVIVTGIVAAMPQQHEAGLRFRLEVESATAGGVPVRLVPLLSLGWYGGVAPAGSGLVELQRLPAPVRAGERWQLAVRVKAPHGNSNPHGFDYELWLWEQGVQATGSVRAGPRDPPAQRLAVTWRHPVERWRQEVRDAVYAQVPDRPIAGVLAALAVGDQNAIERADWDVFRATGVAHLMSISGLHITMFAWLAALVTGALWRRSPRACLAWPAQHAALAGGAVLAAAYALFSGWGVPAQRTVLMLATVTLLRLSGRHWPWPIVWLLAAAVVVTADPWALLQPGFWLSFVAVGVLFASEPASRAAPAVATPLARLARATAAALREQWVVTLALTPLTLLLFGQASLVGLLANAVAIPWVTLVVTPLAIAGAAANCLWTPAGAAVQVLQQFLQWLAGFPFATVTVPAAPLWAGALGVAGGLLLVLRLPWQARLLALPMLLPVLLWQAARPAAGQFELIAADIGQGNAVIVRTAGHTLVYDSGPRYSAESDAGHRVLVPLLRAFGERVQMLVLSHRDTDHTGGAGAVLAQQPLATVLSSLADGHELQAIRASTRCLAGHAWEWDGVRFEVLHPRASDYAVPGKPNTLSCVLRIANGAQAALLAGDIEQAQEARLAALAAGLGAAPLRADVLLVPHHGSRTSSTPVFLDAVQPRIALLQAGYRNRFGHPAPVVLQRLRERGVQVVDSPRCGAAHWRSDAPGEVRCERLLAPRYWLHRVP
jgi:competence protein ComEC